MKNGTLRVLVVDDDPLVLATWVRMLAEYAPLQASGGEEARGLLATTPIDVVVCDVNMPRVSGLDLMRWAREHCPHPLWIVVTGQGTFEAATEALKLGAFDFLTKPIFAAVQLRTAVTNAARQQALVADREVALRSLTENNERLARTNGTLEKAVLALREQQAMIDQDLERAERILQALLPYELRPIDALQVNVGHRPSAAIGGDFYGTAMLDEHHLAIYVADVAGHGVSAALLAVLFKQRLEAKDERSRPRRPAAVLSDLNRALMDECQASGLFVTAAYALIDTSTRTATFASAGHPPAVLLRRASLCRHLEKTGPALGLNADAAYEERTISLDEGDRLLLYTDGMTDALWEGAPDLDTILSTVPADDDGARVIDHLLSWSQRGEGAEDDVTLLLVTARSGASTFDAFRAPTPTTPPHECAIAAGSRDATTWVAIRGHATWKDSSVLRATCLEALDAGRDVVVDLATCTMLDSTVLGTLHEIAVRAEPGRSIRLQGVGARIRGLFEELAMTQVLSSITPVRRSPPAQMTDLSAAASAGEELVLHAHELLAELSAHNAEQFRPVIEAIQGEARH